MGDLCNNIGPVLAYLLGGANARSQLDSPAGSGYCSYTGQSL